MLSIRAVQWLNPSYTCLHARLRTALGFAATNGGLPCPVLQYEESRKQAERNKQIGKATNSEAGQGSCMHGDG